MIKIVAVLALALATLVNVAEAVGTGTGMPMMKGLKSPTELAALMDRSLASDPTGKKLLDPVRCKKDGSCATAHDYFRGIQRAHPSVQLGNIAELPRYLRSLVKQPAPEGEWYLSRMLVRGEKHTYDHAGWKRAFFKGEAVWDDPNTGEHILAGDCGNIIAPRPSAPPPPRPAPPPPPVVPPPPATPPAVPLQAKCYIIPFDYRNTPGVVWDDRHRAHVSAHLDATSERELEEVLNDPCFGVVDAKGFRKPFHRCELCDQGEYPPAGLASAVGLPAEEPKGVLSFFLQDGVGSLSLPLLPWSARWMLFCVDVAAYSVTTLGYEDWQAVSRMDVVEGSEIERTLPKRKLDRTLSGARLY